MTHDLSSRFRVLDSAVVTPSGPWLPPCSLPLTFLDLQWIHSPPVERIFFYRLAAPDNTDQLISNLKRSLSTALRIFFPLAGHLRVTPGITGRHDIFYEPGNGVAFTLAEYDADLGVLASDQLPRKVAELAQLVPRLQAVDAGATLLAVQATVLLPRGHLALGVTVHHAACDGAGSTGFLHTWAASCAGADSLPTPPVIDRTLIAEPAGVYEHYTNNLPSTDEIEFVKMSPDQLLATFTLCDEQLQSVKDVVAAEASRYGQTPPPRCSALVAALGFVWYCYSRAKAEIAGHGCDTERDAMTYFIVPVDHRPWMKPPVPATYLGNCIGPAIGAAPKRDLASDCASGLFTACAAIAEGIEKAVVSPEWETMMERVMEAGRAACCPWRGRRGSACTTSTSGSGRRERSRSCPWPGRAPWRWRRSRRRRHGGGRVAAAGRHGGAPEVLHPCRRVAVIVARYIRHSLIDATLLSGRHR